MKTTINEYEFVEAFNTMGRKDNFSREGRFALFEYLEELEEGTGQEIELDVIALCCEFTEWENLKEFNEAQVYEDMILEEIYHYTTLIIVDEERFITQDF